MKNNTKNGFSIILALVVLTAVMGLGLIASNLVLREAGSVRGIEESEVAYYAAESAAERRLYEYSKKFPNREPALIIAPTTCTGLTDTLDVITDAKWKETALTHIVQPDGWTFDLSGTDTTFELYLDLEGVSYPNRMRATRNAGGDATVVILTINKTTGQETQTVSSGTPAYIPGPGASDNFDFVTNYYRIKIGESQGGSTYTLNTIPASTDIVAGLTINTCGQYRNAKFERRVEVNHNKWSIF